MHWWTLQKLKSKEPRTRLLALEKLIKEEDAANAVHFLNALNDPEPDIRKTAAAVLGKFKVEAALKPLIAALHDRAGDVRDAAVGALKEIGNATAIDSLLPLLKDSESQIRWRAANALESLGWRAPDENARALHAVALGKLDRVANFGAAAIEPLQLVLKGGVGYKRQRAIEVLSKINDPRVVKPLVGALKDEDGNVRTAAVEALTKVGDARAVEPLIGALKDKDNRVRAAAIEALSKIGEPGAIAPIVKLLNDDSWDVRIAAVQSLGKFKDPGVMEPLIACLQDEDKDTRHAAVISLGKIGDARAVQTLILALTDAEDSIRQTTAGVLRRIDSDWEHSPGARQAVPALQQAAKSDTYWVRQAALEVLAKIGEKPLQPDAAGLMTMANQGAAKRQAVTATLLALLADEDRDLRQAAAEALGRLNDAGAVSPLAKALEDEDEWVRHAAASALEALKWQPEDRGQRARQIVILQKWDDAVQLGAAAVPPLVTSLQSKSSAVRQAAIEALAKIGDTRACEPLAERLTDKFRPVAVSAAAALVALGWSTTNRALRATQLVSLGRWDEVVELGAAAVKPLAAAAKSRLEDPAAAEAALHALERITDPAAVSGLILCAAQGDLANAAVAALSQILALHSAAVSEEDLRAVENMRDTRANRYEPDPQTQSLLPAGTEEIDCALLHQMAQMELAERGARQPV